MQKEITFSELVAIETKILSDKLNKSFLDCNDIIQITGLGRDNVRALMKLKQLSVIKAGRRKIVPIVKFVVWSLNNGGEQCL